jgi:hypothetical protein
LISEKLAGFYTKLEDKYFDFLDFLDSKGVPVYKYSDFFENRGVPSFIVTIAIIVLLFALVGVGVALSTPATQEIILNLKDGDGNPLNGVTISVLDEKGNILTGPLEMRDGEIVSLPKLSQGTKVSLIASKDGYQGDQTEVALGTEVATGTLSLAASFQGINATLNLTDSETGTKIISAVVIATWNDMSFNFDVDDNGTYFKSGIPEGKTVTLTATADGYTALSTTAVFYNNSLRSFKMTPSSQSYGQKSSVLINVKDSVGNAVDGAKVTLVNNASEVILLEDYTKKGSVAGSIQTGLAIQILVEKAGYINYDSETVGESITLREKEKQIDVILQQGGQKLKVNVTNKLGLSLDESTVQLFTLDGEKINSGKTTTAGIEFAGLDTNVDSMIVTAHHEGYLAQKKYVSPSATTDLTFTLDNAGTDNSTVLEIFAVDETTLGVGGAKIELYIREDGNVLPYGYSELETPVTGYVSANVERGKSYEVRAQTDVLEGKTTIDVLGKTPAKAYLIMKRKASILEMDFAGPKGEKISGTATVNSVEGDLLYDGNIYNSKIFFDPLGKEVVELTVYLADGNSFLENVNIKGQSVVTVVVYSGVNEALSPKIEFIGLEDEAGNAIDGITPGAFYWAKFSVTYPLGAEQGGVHFRIGNDNEKFVQSGNGAIFDLSLQGANTIYSTSYSPTPTPGNETVDRSNAGQSGTPNKWAEGMINQPSGTYTAKVKVRITEYTAGTIDLKYRAWAINNGDYYRNPEDIALGSDAFTENKSGLYAETKVQQLKLYESLPECNGNICVALNFSDADGKFFDLTSFEAMQGNTYAFEAELSVQEAEIIDLTVSSPDKIVFTTTEKGFFDPSTGFVSSGTITSGFDSTTGSGVDGATETDTESGETTTTGFLSGLTQTLNGGATNNEKNTKWSFAAVDTEDALTSGDLQGFSTTGGTAASGATGKKEMTLRVSVGAGGRERVKFYFIGNTLGGAQINFRAVGSSQIEKAVSFNVVARKALLVELSKSQVNLGEEFTVKVRDANSGKGNIENALVQIINKDGETVKSISGDGGTGTGKGGNYTVENSFDAGLYTVQVSASEYPTKEVPLLVTTKNILDFPSKIEIKMPFNQTQTTVTPQPELINNSEFDLTQITYELNGSDKNKDGEINNFLFNIGLPPTLGNGGKMSIPITANYTGAISDSADETATLVIKAMVEGKFLTQITSKVHVSYNKKLDESCLKIGPSTVTIDLIGTEGSSDSEVVQITNDCEQAISMVNRVKENTAKSYVIVSAEDLDLQPGETTNVTITAENLIDRKFQRDNTYSYEVTWDANYLTKRLDVTVRTINPSLALSYPGQITLWLAQNSERGKAAAIQPIYITNVSNFPVEGITFSVQKEYASGTNVSLNVEPAAVINLDKGQSARKDAYAQAASIITEPVRASILIRGRMGQVYNRSGQRDAYNYYDNYYNDYADQTSGTTSEDYRYNINNYASATNGYSTGTEDLGIIDVMIYYSGFDCFRVSPVDDMSFFVSNSGGQIARRVAIQNDCAEPITVTGLRSATPQIMLSIYPMVTVGVKQRVEAMISAIPRIAMGSFAAADTTTTPTDTTTTTPDTTTTPPVTTPSTTTPTTTTPSTTTNNSSSNNSSSSSSSNTTSAGTTQSGFTNRSGTSAIKTPTYQLKVVGITSISQTPIESRPITIEIYSGDDVASQYSKVNKGVSIEVCGQTEKDKADFPRIATSNDCSNGYCDAKTAAKYLAQNLNNAIKNAESAGYSKQNLSENFGCENQGFCTFGAMGISTERIPLYLQNDRLSPEALSEALLETSGGSTGFSGIVGIGNYDIQPFDVTDTTISMLAQSGYSRRIFLDSKLQGCGYYKVGIDGAFPVVGGQVVFTEPIIVIRAIDFGSGPRVVTKECESNIINVANLNPVDEGYTSGDNKGTWLSTVGGSGALDEIANKIAKERYKAEDRHTAIGPGNRVELSEGPLVDSMAEMCMGSGGDYKTINVTVSSDISKLAKAQGKDTENAYSQVAKMVSDALNGNFGQGNCVTKGAMGYECVQLRNPSGLGNLKMDIKDKTLTMSDSKACVPGKVISGVVESVVFEIQQGQEFKGITKITVEDLGNGTVYKEVTYDGTVIREEKPGVPMVLEFGNKQNEPYSKEIMICAYSGSEKTNEGSPGYLEANGSSFIVQAINKNAGNRETSAADGTITIGIGTLHIDDFVKKIAAEKDKLQKTKDHPYYFTIMWKGGPDAINFKDYVLGLGALGQMPDVVIKNLEMGPELTKTGKDLSANGKRNGLLSYFTTCAIVSAGCSAYTGGWTLATNVGLDCAFPAATMFKDDLVQYLPFLKGVYTWLGNFPLLNSFFKLSSNPTVQAKDWSPITNPSTLVTSPYITSGIAASSATRAGTIIAKLSGGLNYGMIKQFSTDVSDAYATKFEDSMKRLFQVGTGEGKISEEALAAMKTKYTDTFRKAVSDSLSKEYKDALWAGRKGTLRPNAMFVHDFGVQTDTTKAINTAVEAAKKKAADSITKDLGAIAKGKTLTDIEKMFTVTGEDSFEQAIKNIRNVPIDEKAIFDRVKSLGESAKATPILNADGKPMLDPNGRPLMTEGLTPDAFESRVNALIDDVVEKSGVPKSQRSTIAKEIKDSVIGGENGKRALLNSAARDPDGVAAEIISKARSGLGDTKASLELAESGMKEIGDKVAADVVKNGEGAVKNLSKWDAFWAAMRTKKFWSGLGRTVGCGVAANYAGIYAYNRAIGISNSDLMSKSIEPVDFLFVKGKTYKVILEKETNGAIKIIPSEVLGDAQKQMLMDLQTNTAGEKKGERWISGKDKDGRYPEDRLPTLYMLSKHPYDAQQKMSLAGYSQTNIDNALTKIADASTQSLIMRYVSTKDSRGNDNKKRVSSNGYPATEGLAIAIIINGSSEYTSEMQKKEIKDGDGWLKNKLTIAVNDLTNTKTFTKETAKKLFPDKNDKFWDQLTKDVAMWDSVSIWDRGQQ